MKATSETRAGFGGNASRVAPRTRWKRGQSIFVVLLPGAILWAGFGPTLPKPTVLGIHISLLANAAPLGLERGEEQRKIGMSESSQNPESIAIERRQNEKSPETQEHLPDWAIGPFTKYEGNPVLSPSPGKWDRGRFGGGVHNGAVIVKDDVFYYIYRGEQPIDIPITSRVSFICDIGIAVSNDGKNFRKLDEYSPLFRKGDDRRYSYEDVNIAKQGDTYTCSAINGTGNGSRTRR